MHIGEIMLSLCIGIIGGIVSGIIVSRVFYTINMLTDQLRHFEDSLNMLSYTRGYLNVVRQVMEFAYDSELKKESEIKQKGYKSESEYYLAHKDIRWVDADVLINNLLKECRKMADELKIKTRGILVGEKDIQLLYNRIREVIMNIASIKEATFDGLQQVDSEIQQIEAEYDVYKSRIRKVYLKKILTDKIFIVISIIVVILIVITIILITKGV